MRKLLTFIWLALSLATGAAFGQSGAITGSQCVGIDSSNSGTIGISVQNTTGGSAWSGTIQPQVAVGGDPASNTQVRPSTSINSYQSTITANGVFYADTTGTNYFQVCGNTVTNTAQVKLWIRNQASRVSPASGGTGTVSANNGTAGAIGLYAAAGGSTTVGPDANLVDASGTLTYSGSVGLVLPAGLVSAASLNFTGQASNTGMYATANTITWASAGTNAFSLNTSGFEIGSVRQMSWGSAASSLSAVDTTLCRSAAGVVEVNSGTGCGATGLVQSLSATLALATAAIGAHACTAAQTAAMTGVTTSAVIKWSFATTPVGVVGYADATTPFLVVTTFPTANTGNVVVCNTSAASITPGAISVNLRAEL